nr:collagen alpha-4(IV) chain-like [Saimiri boliviensis boliviensis]
MATAGGPEAEPRMSGRGARAGPSAAPTRPEEGPGSGRPSVPRVPSLPRVPAPRPPAHSVRALAAPRPGPRPDRPLGSPRRSGKRGENWRKGGFLGKSALGSRTPWGPWELEVNSQCASSA